MRWLCAAKGATTTCNEFKRAACAAVDAFAEYGAGEVGGCQIGEFSVKNYASQQTTGEELATAAALRELGLSGMAFSGGLLMRSIRPIPRSALPDTMTARVPLPDGTYNEPGLICNARFERTQKVSDDAHRSAGGGTVFVDALNSIGAFEVKAGSRAAVPCAWPRCSGARTCSAGCTTGRSR